MLLLSSAGGYRALIGNIKFLIAIPVKYYRTTLEMKKINSLVTFHGVLLVRNLINILLKNKQCMARFVSVTLHLIFFSQKDLIGL